MGEFKPEPYNGVTGSGFVPEPYIPSEIEKAEAFKGEYDKGQSWAEGFFKKYFLPEKPMTKQDWIRNICFPGAPTVEETWDTVQEIYPEFASDPEVRKAGMEKLGKFFGSLQEARKTIRNAIGSIHDATDITPAMGTIWAAVQEPGVGLLENAMRFPVTPVGVNPFAAWGLLFGLAEKRKKVSPAVKGIMEGMDRIQRGGLKLLSETHKAYFNPEFKGKPFDAIAHIWNQGLVDDPLINSDVVTQQMFDAVPEDWKKVWGVETDKNIVPFVYSLGLNIASHPATYLLGAVCGKHAPGKGKMGDIKARLNLNKIEKGEHPVRVKVEDGVVIPDEQRVSVDSLIEGTGYPEYLNLLEHNSKRLDTIPEGRLVSHITFIDKLLKESKELSLFDSPTVKGASIRNRICGHRDLLVQEVQRRSELKGEKLKETLVTSNGGAVHASTEQVIAGHKLIGELLNVLPEFMQERVKDLPLEFGLMPEQAPAQGLLNIAQKILVVKPEALVERPKRPSTYLGEMIDTETLTHELGHVVMSEFRLADTPEFMAAFRKDCKALGINDPQAFFTHEAKKIIFEKYANEPLETRQQITEIVSKAIKGKEFGADLFSGYLVDTVKMPTVFRNVFNYFSDITRTKGESIKRSLELTHQLEAVGMAKSVGDLSKESITALRKRGEKLLKRYPSETLLGSLTIPEYLTKIQNAVETLKTAEREFKTDPTPQTTYRQFGMIPRGLERIPLEIHKEAILAVEKVIGKKETGKKPVTEETEVIVEKPRSILHKLLQEDDLGGMKEPLGKLVGALKSKNTDPAVMTKLVTLFNDISSPLEKRLELEVGKNLTLRGLLHTGKVHIESLRDSQIQKLMGMAKKNPTISIGEALAKQDGGDFMPYQRNEIADGLRAKDPTLAEEFTTAYNEIIHNPSEKGLRHILNMSAGKIVPAAWRDAIGIVSSFVSKWGSPDLKKALNIVQDYTGKLTSVEYLGMGEDARITQHVKSFAKDMTESENNALVSVRSLMDARILTPDEAAEYLKNDPRLIRFNQRINELQEMFYPGARDTATTLGKKALSNLIETYYTRYPRIGDTIVDMKGTFGNIHIDSPSLENPVSKIITDACAEMFFYDLTGGKRRLLDIDKDPAKMKEAVALINHHLTLKSRAAGKGPVNLTPEQIKAYYSKRQLLLYQARRQGRRMGPFKKNQVSFTKEEIDALKIEENAVIENRIKGRDGNLTWDNILKEAELRQYLAKRLLDPIPYTKLTAAEIAAREMKVKDTTKELKTALSQPEIVERTHALEDILKRRYGLTHDNIKGSWKDISELVFQELSTKHLMEWERVAANIKTPTEMRVRSYKLWRTQYSKDVVEWLTVHLHDLVKYKRDLLMEKYREAATKELAGLNEGKGVSDFKGLIQGVNDMHAYMTSGSSMFQLPWGKVGAAIDRAVTQTSKYFGWAKVSMSPSTHLIQPLQIGYTAVCYGVKNTYHGLLDTISQLINLKEGKGKADTLLVAEKLGILEGMADLSQGSITEMVNNIREGKGQRAVVRGVHNFLRKTLGEGAYPYAKLMMRAGEFLLDAIWNKPTQLYKLSDMILRLASLNAWKRQFPSEFRDAVRAVKQLEQTKNNFATLTDTLIDAEGRKVGTEFEPVRVIDAIRRAVDGINAPQVNYARSGQGRFWYNPTWGGLTGLFKKYDVRMTVDELRRVSDFVNTHIDEKGKRKVGTQFGPDNLIVGKQFVGAFTYQTFLGGLRAARTVGLLKLGLIGLGLGWQFVGTMFRSQEKIDEGTNLSLLCDTLENEINGVVERNKENPAGQLLNIAYNGIFDSVFNISVSDRMAVRADVSPLGNILIHGENLARAIGGEGQAAYESERQKIKDIVTPSMMQGVLQGAVMTRMMLDQLEQKQKEKGLTLTPQEKALQKYVDEQLDWAGVQWRAIVRDMPNVKQEDITAKKILTRMTLGFTSSEGRKEALAKKLIQRVEDKYEAKLAHAVTIEAAKVRGIRDEKEREAEMVRWTQEMYKDYHVTPERIMGRLTNVENRDMSFIKTLQRGQSTPIALKQILKIYMDSGMLREYMLRQAEEDTSASYQRYMFVSSLCRLPDFYPEEYNKIYSDADEKKIVPFLKKWRQ